MSTPRPVILIRWATLERFCQPMYMRRVLDQYREIKEDRLGNVTSCIRSLIYLDRDQRVSSSSSPRRPRAADIDRDSYIYIHIYNIYIY